MDRAHVLRLAPAARGHTNHWTDYQAPAVVERPYRGKLVTPGQFVARHLETIVGAENTHNLRVWLTATSLPSYGTGRYGDDGSSAASPKDSAYRD